ncbi:MAG: hypothetical protein AB7W59_14150 [Acidimicrobiia bacterium]
MGDNRKVPQRSIYLADEPWLAIRRLALDSGTNASALIAALTDWFLETAPAKTREAIIAEAQRRS